MSVMSMCVIASVLVFAPILSLIITFSIIIFRSVRVGFFISSTVKLSTVKPPVKSTIISIKGHRRTTLDQPQQGNGKACKTEQFELFHIRNSRP